MRMESGVVLCTLLAIGCGFPHAAHAQQNDPSVEITQSGSQERPSADQERMICRSEKPIGSNRAVRVCRTRAQMEEERERSRETMRSRGSAPSERGA